MPISNLHAERDLLVSSTTLDGHKPVVICQHGIVDTGTCFMMNGHESVAFRLCRDGYDVWINNARGTRYSRDNGHEFLDVNNKNTFLKDVKE